MLGAWTQLAGFVRERWGRLTAVVAGRRQRRVDAKQLDEWLAREHKADPIHK